MGEIIFITIIACLLFMFFHKRSSNTGRETPVRIKKTSKIKSPSSRVGDKNQMVFRVTGVSFINTDGSSRQEHISKLSTGDSLELIRDPHNPYDINAIKVVSVFGCIGFVPRDMNTNPIFDNINEVSCMIHSVGKSQNGKSGLKISIKSMIDKSSSFKNTSLSNSTKVELIESSFDEYGMIYILISIKDEEKKLDKINTAIKNKKFKYLLNNDTLSLTDYSTNHTLFFMPYSTISIFRDPYIQSNISTHSEIQIRTQPELKISVYFNNPNSKKDLASIVKIREIDELILLDPCAYRPTLQFHKLNNIDFFFLDSNINRVTVKCHSQRACFYRNGSITDGLEDNFFPADIHCIYINKETEIFIIKYIEEHKGINYKKLITNRLISSFPKIVEKKHVAMKSRNWDEDEYYNHYDDNDISPYDLDIEIDTGPLNRF